MKYYICVACVKEVKVVIKQLCGHYICTSCYSMWECCVCSDLYKPGPIEELNNGV